jgi:tRNA threonylcarbamoyladenosine biosynthesis protein TsaB
VRILAVDTALGACSAALIANGVVLAREHRTMIRGHAEALAPMVQALMRSAGVEFSDLDRIGVTTGPGTFTGQRVGLAFARALGLALNKPVVGTTTLDAMAAEALAKAPAAAWAIAAADAKRGEIYLGARSAEGVVLLRPEVIVPDRLAAALTVIGRRYGDDPVLAGTAAEAVMPLLVQAGFRASDSMVRQPDAVFVAQLAADLPIGPPPKPLYLREPDAKIPSGSE